ncbi:MAG: hypothetical protein Q8862_12740 [Bacteroidota bacterium]|nr:hypothetical protein [Bacteroidota bacterium]MDP4204887.1 hypothetical protein [Bacteroidota bacterium]
MPKFEVVDYEQIMIRFQEAEESGLRLKLGDLDTSEWLQQERINQDDLVEASREFPDPRNFIIASGESKGFYVYSNKNKSCIRIVSSEY